MLNTNAKNLKKTMCVNLDARRRCASCFNLFGLGKVYVKQSWDRLYGEPITSQMHLECVEEMEDTVFGFSNGPKSLAALVFEDILYPKTILYAHTDTASIPMVYE